MSMNSQNQEIDLGQIIVTIKNFFYGIVDSVFDLLFFIKKKLIIILILTVIGLTAAFLMDAKVYKHEVAVIPNFDSNEYLYEKIEQVNTKIRESDSSFFKDLGVKNYQNIKSIKIDAYPGVYRFVDGEQPVNNFEIIRLMAESGNIDKVLTDETTSRNYYNHKITIKTKGTFKKEEFITPLLNYLNASTHFEVLQKIQQKNLRDKIIFNDSLMKQIDKIVFSLTAANSSGALSFSAKGNIAELIEKKDDLMIETQNNLVKEHVYDKIIKEEGCIMNFRDYNSVFLSNKVLFPLLLIGMYLFLYLFSKSYKKQLTRINA